MNIQDCIEEHPLWKFENAFRQRIVRRHFQGLIPDGCPAIWSNSLFPFATQRPLTYASHSGIRNVLTFLRTHERQTLEALSSSDPGFSRAVTAVALPGPSWLHEESAGLSKAHELAQFENLWHPEYQRYAEHAFNHLINLPLGVLGSLAQKDYRTPSLANRVEILKKHNDLNYLVEGFDSVVRNAVSHGHVEFSQFGILFHDRRGTREVYPDQFLQEFDALVRSTVELLVGCILFLLHSWQAVESFGVNKLPLGLHYLALAGGGCHRHCTLERLLRSEATENRKQINITCSTASVSRGFHQLEALRLASLAQDLSQGKYDRASVSFECGRLVASSAFLDLRELDKIRRGDKPFEALDRVFEGSLLWHDVPPWRRKIDSARFIVPISWDNLKEEVLDRWRELGIEPARSLYVMRHVKNLSVETLRRVEGILVWSGRCEVDQHRLRKIGLHAASQLRRSRVRQLTLAGEAGGKRRPSHIWFRLFVKDNALRRLDGRGGKNRDILMEGEWKNRSSKSEFVFVSQPSEIVQGVRLEYFL